MKPKVTENVRVLIEDLIKAIDRAAWRDSNDKPNLFGPTHHMKTAVENLEAVIYPVICPTCNQRVKE